MKLNTYQKVALTTVGATIFLIFVGGLVRAAGAWLHLLCHSDTEN